MDIGERTEATGLGHHLHILWRQLVKTGEPDHEELETGVAVRHRICHLGNDARARLQNGRVEAVIDHRFSLGLFLPGGHSCLDRLSRFGQGIIDNGGDPPTRRR